MSEVLRSAFQRAFRRENRRVAVRRGRLERIPGFESQILGNRRDITVYLPPGYDDNAATRYPVLYMQDGQNLFEAERAFGGTPWRLGDAADDAIAARTVRPFIIVGIDHAGVDRVNEFTPVRDENRKAGGNAANYARMVIDEIKTVIDAGYRTLPDRAHTGTGGSSLGGLAALFLALRHPDVFGRAAVMSPSVWWGGRAILRELETVPPNRPLVWLDIGGKEGREALADARLLRDRMIAKGWSWSDFRYYEDRRADHSERAWGGRVRQGLEFLFAPE